MVVFHHQISLQEYVTSGYLVIFNLLSVNCQEEAKMFSLKPPELWHLDLIYQLLKSKVKLLKFVSNCAERGVALFQAHHSALTKDETQKQ